MAIKKTLFITSRDNNAGMISYDPAAGTYIKTKHNDVEINAVHDRGTLLTHLVMCDIMQKIHETPVMKNSFTTIYVPDRAAINTYAIINIAKLKIRDRLAPTEQEIETVVSKFVADINSRLAEKGLEPLSEGAQNILGGYAQWFCIVMNNVVVKKISDVKTMLGSQGNRYRELAAMAWDLLPQSKLQEVDADGNPVVGEVDAEGNPVTAETIPF